MDSTLYTELKTLINASLPQIKYVALWNNQLHEEKSEKAFNRPAILIEFQNMRYDDYTQGVDRVTGTLRLHCVFNTWKPEDDLGIMDTVEAISKVIDEYTPLYYAPFDRQAEEMDANHSAVVDWMLDFTLSGVSLNSWTDKGKGTHQVDPALTGTLIQQRNIRTDSPNIT